MQSEFVLELNIKKCKHMTFFRHPTIDTFYCIGNAVLDKVKAIFDLDILLDHILNFRYNISMIANEAYLILGYMKHWSKDLIKPYLTQMLFISHVLPILEYGSIIWNP